MVDPTPACAQIDADRLARVINGIQKSVNWRDRAAVANALALCTNDALPRATLEMRPALRAHADALTKNGIAYLGRLLSPVQVAAIHAHLKDKPCYPGHVPVYGDGIGRTIEACAQISNCGSYLAEDVLAAPHLLELANSPDLLAIAESYLNCTPTIYSMNLFWSFPNRNTRYGATQNFHRDFDDFRFCTVFVFLTEVELDDGAHYFMRGTHRPEFVEQAYRERIGQPAPIPLDRFFATAAYDDNDCPKLFAGETETVTASAGEAVIEDTYGYHRGDIPRSNRLLGWIRYGLYRNVTAFGDNPRGPAPRALGSGRIPDTARHKFINRLIVEP